MTTSLSRKLLMLSAAAGLGLAAAPNAHALLMLAATADGANVCAADNNAPCSFGAQIADINPAVGILELPPLVPVGPLTVAGSLHFSATGPFDILTSSSLAVTNTSGLPVTAIVAVGATDFTPPVNTAFTSGSGTFVQPTGAGSSIVLTWFNDPANTQGATTPTNRPGLQIDTFAFPAIGVISSFSHNGGPFAVLDLAPFSMTLGFDFTLAPLAALISRGQGEIKTFVAVPEPATLLLMGLGLTTLALIRRRRNTG